MRSKYTKVFNLMFHSTNNYLPPYPAIEPALAPVYRVFYPEKQFSHFSSIQKKWLGKWYTLLSPGVIAAAFLEFNDLF